MFSRADFQGSTICFLLEVEFASRTWYFSSFPIDLSSDDGDRRYVGGLENFTLSETSDMLGVDLEGNSFSTAVIFPDLDMVANWRSGIVIEGQPAELSFVLVRDGVSLHTYEERELILSGVVEQPVFGDPMEHVGFCSFTVSRPPWGSAAALLNPDTQITPGIFAGCDPSADGKYMPIVFGGNVKRITTWGASPLDPIYSTPAYAIEQYNLFGGRPKLLISYGEVEATSVRVIDSWGRSDVFSVETASDTRGNVYSYVNIFAALAVMYVPTEVTVAAVPVPQDPEWWVAWETGGGMRNPFGDGSLEGGGDLLLYILQSGGLEVDVQSFVSLAPILNTYRFHGYVNDPDLDGWTYASENLIPFLPIEIRNGPRGIKAILALLYATISPVRPMEVIEVNPDFYISGPITTETETTEIYNDISLQFGRVGTAPPDTLMSFARIGEGLEGDYQEENDAFAAFSQQRYGIKKQSVESEMIYDQNIAGRVLRFLLRSQAFPIRTIEISGSSKYGYVQIGDAVQLSGGVWDKMIVICVKKIWDGFGWGFTFAFEDTPLFLDRYDL